MRRVLAGKVGVRMTTHSENEWKKIVETAGFDVLRCFRAAPSDDWPVHFFRCSSIELMILDSRWPCFFAELSKFPEYTK